MELNALTRWSSINKDLNRLEISPSQEFLKLKEKFKRVRSRAFASRPFLPSTPTFPSSQLILSYAKPWKLLVKIFRIAIRRGGKAALVGFLGKLAFNVLGQLLRSKLNAEKFLQLLMKNWKFVVGDPINYGLFLSGFVGSFEFLYRTLHHFGNRLLRKYRAAVAAAFGSLSLFFIPQANRQMIALFFFVRALEIAARWLYLMGYVPNVPHGDVLTMCVASALVLGTWIHYPEFLDNSYNRFLNTQGGKARPIVDSYSGFILYGYLGNLYKVADVSQVAKLNDMRLAHNIPALSFDGVHPEHRETWQRLMCSVIHPNHSDCFVHFFSFLKEGFKRAVPVYLPVYIIPQVLFRFKKLFTDPFGSASHTVLGIMQSSSFLACYCGLAWLGSCFARRYLKLYHIRYTVEAGAGIASGLSLFIEKGPRRVELALYVLSQAISSTFRRLAHFGFLPYVKNIEIYGFAIAMMIAMTAFAHLEQIVRPSYRSLLEYCFGRPKLLENEDMEIGKIPISADSDVNTPNVPGTPKSGDEEERKDLSFQLNRLDSIKESVSFSTVNEPSISEQNSVKAQN
jgi:hypothetical protein